MAIVRITNLAQGVNTDAMPEDLPLGVWTVANNVTHAAGMVRRADAMVQKFDAPSITPYWIAPFRTATAMNWLHFGLAKCYVDDGTTRTEITRTVGGNFTGTTSDRWTGGDFNGFFIANNGVDSPMSWTGSTAADFVNLTGWTASYKAKTLRPWQYFLVAGNVTTNTGTRLPYRVWWSDLAQPGTLPTTWNPATTTGEARWVDLSDAGGPIVDMLPLGDQLVIYTNGSAHAMRYVGGQDVMSISRLQGNHGMLTQGCAAVTPMGHVVLTTGDVVLHSGGAPESIADGRVRDTIFAEMSNATAERLCFVVSNVAANEAWICYPGDGAASCTRAAIWNWKHNAWSFRDLRNCTSGAVGQVPTTTGTSFDADAGTFDSATDTFGGRVNAPNDAKLMLSHIGPYLSVVQGTGSQDLGINIRFTLRRTGMHFDDPQRMKLLRSVWPKFDAPAGTTIDVRVGASNTPDVDPTWQTAQTFTVGTSTKIDSFTQGRYLALEFSCDGCEQWRLRGVDLDIVPTGLY